MSKRTAAKDLNHENWDIDDDKEEPGTFRRVTGDELKKRVIRKAKRSFNNNSTENNSLQGSSPFAAFSGFAGASSSPFSQLKKTDSSGRSPLHSDNQKVTKTENGGSSDAQTNQSEKDTKASATGSATKPTRNIEYYRQLQSLNESVLKWIQLHLGKNSCSDFTPVFNDYKKHVETLNLTYPVQKEEGALGKDNAVLTISTTSKDSTTSRDSFSESGDSILKKSKGNGGGSKSEEETDYGANFSARTTNTSTFSFGMKNTPSATSSITPHGPTSSSKEEEKASKPFQFSSSTKEDEKASKPFQFTFGNKFSTDSGSTTGFSFASAIAAKSSEPVKVEDENYEPPKNEFVAVAEEDALYSKKCKLFFKKGEGFSDKGVGMLYLKSLEGKTQLLIRADTNLGNILLNIMLSASLPMSRTGKNNVLLVCVPNPPIDAKNPNSKEAIPMLIRVKTAEDADELLENLNKHKS